MAITKGELQEWKEHPLTQEAFKVIREQREQWSSALETGGTLNGTTTEATAKAVGVLYGIDLLLKIHIEEEEVEESE